MLNVVGRTAAHGGNLRGGSLRFYLYRLQAGPKTKGPATGEDQQLGLVVGP